MNGEPNLLLLSGEKTQASIPTNTGSVPCTFTEKVCCFMTERLPPVIPEVVKYYNLEEVRQDAVKAVGGWTVLKSAPTLLVLGFYDQDAGSLSRKITVDENLHATITLGDVTLKGMQSLEKMLLRNLLKQVLEMNPCEGITDDRYQNISCNQAYRFVSTKVLSSKPVVTSLLRSKTCEGMSNQSIGSNVCQPCSNLLPLLDQCLMEVRERLHPKTPLSVVSRNDLIREVKATREDARKLESQVRQLQGDLYCKGVKLSQDVSDGLASVIDSSSCTGSNELMKLFWAEQKKAFSMDPRGMRWHPMLIRFAIYLQYQSPRAYAALKDTGVLRLPNKSTLRDYTNVIQPKTGFQPHVFEELQEQAKDLPDTQRFVALLHDEMTVKSDLVYDHRGGEVVGFINPDRWTFQEDMADNLASHVLVFMIVGINSHLKMSIGHIATKSATADELFPLLWTAIAYLEVVCKLKVISSTSDKASPNQRLYRLHKIGNEACVYRAVNTFAADLRYIYFSDAPHLVKTIRNNLSKSKAGGTRYLWNNNHHILWSHITKIYDDDINRQLYRTKLTFDHINLTPTSTMSVRLAAQVLSRSVSQVMRTYYGPEMTETANFLHMCDRFFDCLNVRSMREDVLRRKPDLAPYRSVHDQRFQFLEVEFLGYLERWRQSTQTRPGFTKSERNRMFLSYQTYEGIVMTVKAFIEATRFLLMSGLPYILSQDYCQDPLEEHFGRHRGLANRNDNPTVLQFGYQENQLRIQRNLAFTFNPKGNTAGRNQEKRPTIITNSPLKKIKRH